MDFHSTPLHWESGLENRWRASYDWEFCSKYEINYWYKYIRVHDQYMTPREAICSSGIVMKQLNYPKPDSAVRTCQYFSISVPGIKKARNCNSWHYSTWHLSLLIASFYYVMVWILIKVVHYMRLLMGTVKKALTWFGLNNCKRANFYSFRSMVMDTAPYGVKFLGDLAL